MLFQIIYVYVIVACCFAKPSTESYFKNQLSIETGHWADAAFEFVQNLTCKDSVLTTEEDCWRLTSVEKSKMNFYSASADPGEKLLAVLPDGPLSRSGTHDAVIVLDPYPEANLGHLLIVFFINLGWGDLQCELNGGHYIGESACMSLALRKRCHNMLMESKWKLKFLNKQYKNKLCEINFFPLVHLAGEMSSQNKQRLECRDDMEGFAPCPVLRPLNATENLACDPLQTNTQSCFLPGKSRSDPSVNTRCRLFERCDHAIAISGGWDRLTDRPLYMENMMSMHKVLKDNGFPDGNIKMFYSNGKTDVNDLDNNLEIYPSALKLHFRNHIRKLCQSVHCADSIVLYLTGPTTSDGSMLLWDIDGNGRADDNEMYTLKELLYDTNDCVAQQVFILADQSYSGILINALESSEMHSNVMAFSSGTDHEYSWNGEFTKHWQSFSSGLQRTDICVHKSFEAVREYMNSSIPLFYDGSNGTINKTLFGAPCDVRPPFTEHELKRQYLGCQNLPTSVWLRRRKVTIEQYDYE